jgi:hypothetical protein
MFVRNSGNEGFCSQDNHYLDLQDGSYTFRLPWKFPESLSTFFGTKPQRW